MNSSAVSGHQDKVILVSVWEEYAPKSAEKKKDLTPYAQHPPLLSSLVLSWEPVLFPARSSLQICFIDCEYLTMMFGLSAC